MWRRNYHPFPQNKGYFNETMQSAGTPVRFYSILWCSCPDSTFPVLQSNRVKTKAKTLLHLAFILIAVCIVLCVFLISLALRHEFPADSAKLEKNTYANFDLLDRNGTKTNTRFSPIQGLLRALALGSIAEPDKVYPQWPMSFLTAYGAVPYNDRRLLVAPRGGTSRHHRDAD